MTLHEISTAILGALTALLGWLAKELWGIVKDHGKELDAFKEKVADDFVKRNDFSEFKTQLFSALDRIEHKLDTKQDK